MGHIYLMAFSGYSSALFQQISFLLFSFYVDFAKAMGANSWLCLFLSISLEAATLAAQFVEML